MLLPEHERKVQMSEADLKKLKREDCDICDVDLNACHDSAMKAKELTAQMMMKAMNVRRGPKVFLPGRLVVVLDETSTRTIGVLADGGIHTGPQPLLRVLVLKPESNNKQPGKLLPERELDRKMTDTLSEDLIPFAFHSSCGITSLDCSDRPLRAVLLPVTAIEHLTRHFVSFDHKAAQRGEIAALQAAQEELRQLSADFNLKEWDEIDWTKLKDLTFLEAHEARKKELEKAPQWKSTQCPDFKRHVSLLLEMACIFRADFF